MQPVNLSGHPRTRSARRVAKLTAFVGVLTIGKLLLGPVRTRLAVQPELRGTLSLCLIRAV